MLKDIVEARWLGGHRLQIRFEDGVEGEIDLGDLVDFKGVFEPLKDPEVVSEVSVNADLGTVVWPSGADLDPVVLYSRITGRPIEFERVTGTAKRRD